MPNIFSLLLTLWILIKQWSLCFAEQFPRDSSVVWRVTSGNLRENKDFFFFFLLETCPVIWSSQQAGLHLRRSRISRGHRDSVSKTWHPRFHGWCCFPPGTITSNGDDVRGRGRQLMRDLSVIECMVRCCSASVWEWQEALLWFSVQRSSFLSVSEWTFRWFTNCRGDQLQLGG